MPPVTFADVRPAVRSRYPVAAAERLPPAQIMSSGRSFGSVRVARTNSEIGTRTTPAARTVRELVRLTDVDEQRPCRIGGVGRAASGRDRGDAAGGIVIGWSSGGRAASIAASPGRPQSGQPLVDRRR